MELESYFDFSNPNIIRLKGTGQTMPLSLLWEGIDAD